MREGERREGQGLLEDGGHRGGQGTREMEQADEEDEDDDEEEGKRSDVSEDDRLAGMKKDFLMMAMRTGRDPSS